MLATKIILAIVVLLTIVLPIGYYFIVGKKKNRSRAKTLAVNIITFASAFIATVIVLQEPHVQQVKLQLQGSDTLPQHLQSDFPA